jgi:hypothetical protein
MDRITDFEQYAHTVDAAKLRAARLRSEAIDAFWVGGAQAARHALRSAQRFAQSLARHQRLRATQRLAG